MAIRTHPTIYDGDGDRLMEAVQVGDHVTLLPDISSAKVPDQTRRLRIMWGQSLLDDLLAGRYRSLVCAVNAHDNSHGIIAQVADLLPTSQWTESTITGHAAQFVQPHHVTVVKYDLDIIEVLALLRPQEHEHMSLEDLARGFKIVAEMLRRRSSRLPSTSVSFLGASANALVDDQGNEPTFETVLRTMYESQYDGDVYPAPYMWESATGVYARYPFPVSLERMREGGF